MTDVEPIIEAIHELVLAVRGAGLKPPSSISFHTASTRNHVSDAALAAKQAGNPIAEKYVTVTPQGDVEIDGLSLKVRF